MLFDRRDFLKSAGAGFLAMLLPRAAEAAGRADALFATAFQRRDGTFGVALLTDAGKLVDTVALPDRGHDIAVDLAARRSVAFARRPGTFMVVFDLDRRLAPVTIASQPGRHFFGHGLFSPDGRLLYATENDFEAAAGMIGVFDATDGFRRIGEFPTGGMDPHEMVLMPDGRMLAVANGGIETHPDFGRAKLNLATMQPSLVFLDRETGALREKRELAPALHQLSIRHLAVDGGGKLWFGCQHEGAADETPPLVGSVRLGDELALLSMPDAVLGGFRNYIGSVAANPVAGTVAVASPQGNQMAVIDARAGAVLHTVSMDEVCGLAPDRDGYLASAGTGALGSPEGERARLPDYVWDNHLLRVEG